MAECIRKMNEIKSETKHQPVNCLDTDKFSTPSMTNQAALKPCESRTPNMSDNSEDYDLEARKKLSDGCLLTMLENPDPGCIITNIRPTKSLRLILGLISEINLAKINILDLS